MRHLHYWYNNFKISLNLSKALTTGKVRKVIEDFDDRINNINSKVLKWAFLSAHDTDVSALGVELNFTSARCVEDLYRFG